MSARASRRRPRRARRTGRGRRSGGSLGDVEADECGADRACGGSELRGDDAYPVAHGTERLALHDLERRRDQVLPAGDAEAAADDDQLRGEDVREGSHRRAEVAADVGKDLARLTVALVREPDQTVRVGRRAEGVLRRQRRGETGDIRLEMAVPAAGALAGTAFMDDHHVGELDARAAVAAEGGGARDHPAPARRAPEKGGPQEIPPPPRPVPSVSITMSSTPRPAPARHSPIAAELASLSRPTGSPKRSDMCSRSGKSRSGRFTHSTTTPSIRSIGDGTPNPIAATSSPRSVETAASSSRMTASWESCGVSRSCLRTISPSCETTAASISVPPRSIPIECVPSTLSGYRNPP